MRMSHVCGQYITLTVMLAANNEAKYGIITMKTTLGRVTMNELQTTHGLKI